MKKQTAVKWLVQEIKNAYVHSKSTAEWNDIFQQAEAMEWEQLMNAYLEGESDADHYEDSASRFYNETYGGYK